MNLEEARKLAREAYIISIDLTEDEDTVEGMRRTILELADELEQLKNDLADWWEMSRGGTLDEDMEHLQNLMDEHHIPKRMP